MRRRLVLLVVVAAVFGSLTIAERDWSLAGDRVEHGTQLAGVGALVDHFGRAEPQTGGPRALAVQAGIPGGVAGATSPEAALAIARDTGSSVMRQVQQVVAQQQPSAICAVLLATRAQVIAEFNALIAQFPFLAPQLTDIRNALLAQIDAQLAAFECEFSP